jgi:5-methylcytosine-specific restriction protein B
VLAAAVERAPAGLEVLPAGARERQEARRARAWELSGARGAATLESVARRFCAYAAASGAVFPLDLARCVLVGLSARPFAVLTGVSGTGKTRLAQLLARFLTEALPGGAEGDRDGPRVALVPVRPDWLDSRGVLGYFNALQGAGAYEDTAALRLLLRACRHPEEPHFLILDEMNLARVEHYLAELLSAMESGEAIPLHGRPGGVPTVDGARVVPPAVPVAPNLFVVGTINVDETTHPFSLKVLDRAWTWEFVPSPPTELLRAWLKERRVERPATEDERRALLRGDAPEDPVRPLVLALGRDGVGQRVDRLFEAMAACGRPFGFRVATELLRFVHQCERGGIDAPPSWHLDHAVLGKVLPRLSGTRRDLEAVLAQLSRVCGKAPEEPSGGVREEAPRAPWAPLAATLAKLLELQERLATEAFVTFAR